MPSRGESDSCHGASLPLPEGERLSFAFAVKAHERERAGVRG